MTEPAVTNRIQGFTGDYKFLSNFHPCAIVYNGLIFPSVEHAYQASKAIKDADRHKFIHVSAKEAKYLGKTIDRKPDFDDYKVHIMYNLILQKFIPATLREKLVKTYPSVLEETNTWNDTYWGICYGLGENMLGKLLMQARHEYIAFQIDNPHITY